MQLLYVRDQLVAEDYTAVLTALMRFPRVDDPFQFFQVTFYLLLLCAVYCFVCKTDCAGLMFMMLFSQASQRACGM